MTNRQKSKLVWVGKENQSMVESRVLLEATVPNYHAERRITSADF